MRECGVSVEMGDACVYMLRCADGTLYTGWSTDVSRRLARHRAGKASRYTASRLPVELALVLPMADRTAARREEARIKGLDRTAKLALIGRSAGGAAPAGGVGGEVGGGVRA
jgi:putative endonuclease